jgi:CRISPR-associated protein Cst1
MDSSIKISADEWMITAGLIGFTRLVGIDNCDLSREGLRLYSKQLDDLAERYVKYLIENFSVAERDYQRLQRYESLINRRL